MSEHKEIRKFPDAMLKEKVPEVTEFGKELEKVSKKMLRVMEEADGIGLAANQIGYLLKMFVAKLPDEKPIIMVNPMIIEADGEDEMEEGCLSVPGIGVEIQRATRLYLKGFNTNGKEIEYELKGLIARVAQHEIDHLNGILIVDYLSGKEFFRFQMEYEKMKERKEL
ncbi:peptide deformylase [candidate division WOR-3 bacterium]|nr:peptide deformylase [candidate division WOR-3 bacterium]